MHTTISGQGPSAFEVWLHLLCYLSAPTLTTVQLCAMSSMQGRCEGVRVCVRVGGADITSLQVITVIDRQVNIEDQLAPNIYMLGLVVAEELGLSRYMVLVLQRCSLLFSLPGLPRPTQCPQHGC